LFPLARALIEEHNVAPAQMRREIFELMDELMNQALNMLQTEACELSALLRLPNLSFNSDRALISMD
jgi:hypothetical protein